MRIWSILDGLSNVEAPVDAKTQYSETKIVKLDVKGKTNYKYEDDYIDIMWIVTSTQFNFVLKNKSNYSIKIPWDDISYISPSGQTGRAMHSGVKYIDRNNSQTASVVPKKVHLLVILLCQPIMCITSADSMADGVKANYSILQ